MNIVTNNVPRPLLYGYELSAEQVQKFDYLTKEEIMCTSFVLYKNCLYSLDDIMYNSPTFTDFKGWDGYIDQAFSSGVLFRLSQCGEFITCGRYYS